MKSRWMLFSFRHSSINKSIEQKKEILGRKGRKNNKKKKERCGSIFPMYEVSGYKEI